SLGFCEPRVCTDVADGDRLTAPVHVDQGLSKGSKWSPTEERGHAVGIAPGDVELIAVDRRVAHAINAKVLPEETRRDLLHLDWIAQRTEAFVERDEKLQAFFARAQRSLGASALHGFPRPLGDVTDQLDFSWRPEAWRHVVRTEGGHEASA